MVVKPPNRFWSQPPLDEGARLDDDVVVCDEDVSRADLGEGGRCPLVVIVTGRKQREQGRGVD